MPHFIAWLMTILVLIGMVFVITWEMFHGRVSLNSVLLLLLVNFVSGFRLELMYISLIVSIRSNFTYPMVFRSLCCCMFMEITFFVCTNRINLLNLKQSSGRLVIVAKGFLNLPNLHMLLKQKGPSLPRNLALGTFLNIVLNKGKSAIPPLFNRPEVLSSASDKSKLFAKNFSKNSNINGSGIPLPIFPSRTNLKLHNISITPKMVKNVITNLGSSKASGLDCIPVVVLKNCEPELSYILAELFSMCLKGSCFPDCWKVSSVVPVLKNVGERSTAKNYHLVSLLPVVSKVFEKLVNNRIVDHLEKCGLFLISSMVLGLLDQLQIF